MTKTKTDHKAAMHRMIVRSVLGLPHMEIRVDPPRPTVIGR